jgi:hypothetical protein
MNKHFNKLIIFLLVFGFVFSASSFVLPETVFAQCSSDQVLFKGECVSKKLVEGPNLNLGGKIAEIANDVFFQASGLATMASAVLGLVTLIVWLVGGLLNLVIQYTIVDFSQNLSGDVISNAWKVIRDVANMAFIFVLLYAAIQTILGVGKDTQRLIVRVVVVAVLINFSLFFTRVVIDISNVLAMTFYDVIAPKSLESTASTGIGGRIMDLTGIQTLFDIRAGGILNGSRVFTIGVMGSILGLIVAFALAAIALMFVIRFAVLIFVLVLSPIAFIAFVLPQAEKYKNQWLDALTGQAFFAPIYFMLTWVAISIAGGFFPPDTRTWSEALLGKIEAASGHTAAGDITIVLNFIIIITLILASLIIAKEWANKAGPGVSKLTGWATGMAGGATIGLAGRFGRNTLGRAGVALGENERLKEMVAKGGAKGMMARLALASGRKTGGASFDMRGTGFGGQLDAGKAGGKGGFAEYRKKKAESEAKFAVTLGASDKTVAKAVKELEDTKKIDTASPEFERKMAEERDRIRTELDGLERQLADERDPDKKTELDNKIRETYDRFNETESIDAYSNGLVRRAQSRVDELKGVDDERARQILIERGEETTKPNIARMKKEFKSAGEVRKQAFATATEKSIWAKFRGYNYAAAAQIRKGKSAKDKIADAVKDLNKEEGGGEEEAAEKPAEGKPAEEKGEGGGGEGTKT